MKNVLKLILAVFLLLCLAPMPYGYFQLVRLFSTIAFGLMTFQYYKEGKEKLAYTFGTLVLVFQPLYKISLGRTVWNVIDVIVAIGLIILFFLEWRNGQRGNKTTKIVTPGPPTSQNQDNGMDFKFTHEGKLAPNELIYVASEDNKEFTDLFDAHPEVLEGWGQMIGFHIVYLPLLIKKLKNKKVLQYRAPYLSDAEVKGIRIGNDFLLQFLDNPNDRTKIKQGFIRTENIHREKDGKDKTINRFYPLSSQSGESIGDQLHRIGKQIFEDTSNCQSRKWLVNESALDDSQMYIEGRNEDADNHFNSQLDNESIDDLIDEVKERVVKLRQRGVSQFILEQLIHPDDRLSRLIITQDYRILLPDYNNMEIKMEPLVKAVYLLFLRYPEGISFKRLPEYREELTKIYNQLRPSGLTERAIQSIEDVTNPMQNSINEKCARIRGAFLSQFDDHMARHYYIDGRRGEVKKISLPRALVVWE